MLRHLGERAAADRITAAVEKVYREKRTLTRDIGGTASTSEFADAVITAISDTQ
jgi:isocitrate dehydrogenase (NAD+)